MESKTELKEWSKVAGLDGEEIYNLAVNKLKEILTEANSTINLESILERLKKKKEGFYIKNVYFFAQDLEHINTINPEWNKSIEEIESNLKENYERDSKEDKDFPFENYEEYECQVMDFYKEFSLEELYREWGV